jgi:hypothetical protein
MSGSSSAQVPVDICNLALGKLGSKFITSLTGGDTSNEALQCQNVYYDKVDELLGKCPWSFAQSMVLLAQVTNVVPAFGNLNNVFAKPSDCIKVNYKNVLDCVKIVGPYLYTSALNLGIKYTFRNYNVATYFPEFKVALACLIAADICFPLTNSVKKAEALMQEYNEVKLPEAISSDSQQGSPDPVVANEWDNARRIGNPALIGPSAANAQWIWYPID